MLIIAELQCDTPVRDVATGNIHIWSHRKLLYKQPPTLAEIESCMVTRPVSSFCMACSTFALGWEQFCCGMAAPLLWAGSTFALEREFLCSGLGALLLQAGSTLALGWELLCSGLGEPLLWPGSTFALGWELLCPGLGAPMLWTGSTFALDWEHLCQHLWSVDFDCIILKKFLQY